ncbi:MAG: hypothetical protein ABJP45_06140 [Cyclobacteriaceae bacterium]
MNKSKQTGIIMVLIGAFTVYWAQSHSPKDLGQIVGNELSGSYTMSETWYYISLIAGIAVIVYGISKIIKGR